MRGSTKLSSSPHVRASCPDDLPSAEVDKYISQILSTQASTQETSSGPYDMRSIIRYLAGAQPSLRSSLPLRPSFILSKGISTSKVSLNAQGQGTKVIHPTLGVAAAMKAMEDSSFKPKVQIFDEFALKDGVAVVSEHGPPFDQP